MGTVFKVLGVVFLLLIVGFVALMIWSHGKGESTQEDFFAAISSRDVGRLYAWFHPSVQAEVDEEVLAVWMAAVRENLGDFKGLKGSDFSTSSRIENGVTVLESKGAVELTKAEARSELRLVDGKIVAFKVHSDAMPDPWLTGIPDTGRYVDLGHECIEKLMTGDVEGGSALMDESLRKLLPPEKLGPGLERLRNLTGELVSVEKVDETFEAAEPPELKIRYRVKGEKSEVMGDITFKFTPWKGQLLAIDLPAD